jgi:hypothetical protein
MLKSGLHIAPGAVTCPGDVCEGTWLLEQPVSHGVAILLENRLAQSADIERSCVEVAELKRADSGDIFFKSMRKFAKAAEAEIIPDLLNSNELIDFTSETSNQRQSALAPMPVCTLENSTLDASAIMHSPDSTRCTLAESSLEENNGQISEVHTAGSEDGTAQAHKTVRLADAGERDRQGDRERDRESLSTDIEGSHPSAQHQNGDALAETPAGEAVAPDTTIGRKNSDTTRIDTKREIRASPASLPLAGLPIIPSPRIPV